MVAYRLGTGEVPGSNPGKGENFFIENKKLDCSNLNTNNCRISAQKETTEEIRTKIIRKRPVCDTKSGKRKSFPLSLLWGGEFFLLKY